jgi:hypothetical protein
VVVISLSAQAIFTTAWINSNVVPDIALVKDLPWGCNIYFSPNHIRIQDVITL